MSELVGSKAVQDALRNADADIRRAMAAAIKSATASLPAEIEKSARATLPAGGGLNDYVARIPVKVKTITSGKTVTFTAEATGNTKHHQPGKSGRRRSGTFGANVDLRAINRGRVMHPVWGRGPLVGPQMVKPGYWTRPLEGPVAQRALKQIREALEDVAKKIARSA